MGCLQGQLLSYVNGAMLLARHAISRIFLPRTQHMMTIATPGLLQSLDKRDSGYD